MALVFINGFDDNMHSASTGGLGTWTGGFSTTVFRTGTASLSNSTASNNNSWSVLPVPGGGDATVIIGFALEWSTGPPTFMSWFFESDNGATVHVSVNFVPGTGVLTAYRGTPTSGTSLGSVTLSGTALTQNTWNYWETKVVLSDTVGEVHVRVNGIAVLDITGVDTKNAGTKTVLDSVSYPQAPNTALIAVDDFYVVTGTGTPNDFLGDCKVSTLYPNGNGDFSQLVGSDADSTNNYLLVNETGAPVVSSYVESDTVGRRDFYTMGDISIPANSTVLGVQVTAYVNNPDAGSGRAVKVGVRQGSSEALSGSLPLTAATFLADRAVFTVDPATGAAWSQAGVNSAQAGMEVA